MGRQTQDKSPSEAMPTTIFLASTASAGEIKEYNFIDGSIKYFESKLKNSFKHTMVDNIGSGNIRISYNRPSLDITGYTDGAKTLKPGDSIYVEESVWFIKIYYIESSIVELVLKSDKYI